VRLQTYNQKLGDKRMLERLKADWKKQDWANHCIGAIMLFVGILSGTIVANMNQGRLDEDSAIDLLRAFQADLPEALDINQDTQAYFSASREAAISALSAWDDPTKMSDLEFIRTAIRASQIITPSRELDNYSRLFDAEILSNIPNERVRAEVSKFIGYDTSIFALSALMSDYRVTLQRVVPYAVQKLYASDCDDVEIETNRGLKHVCKGKFTLNESEAAKVASLLRANEDLPLFLNQYIKQMDVLGFNLSRYRCNALIANNHIARLTRRTPLTLCDSPQSQEEAE